jgi:hypothetical protein
VKQIIGIGSLSAANRSAGDLPKTTRITPDSWQGTGIGRVRLERAIARGGFHRFVSAPERNKLFGLAE